MIPVLKTCNSVAAEGPYMWLLGFEVIPIYIPYAEQLLASAHVQAEQGLVSSCAIGPFSSSPSLVLVLKKKKKATLISGLMPTFWNCPRHRQECSSPLRQNNQQMTKEKKINLLKNLSTGY